MLDRENNDIKINVLPDNKSQLSVSHSRIHSSGKVTIYNHSPHPEEAFWDVMKFQEYLIQVFHRIDADGSGALDHNELKQLFREVCTTNELPMAAQEDIDDILKFKSGNVYADITLPAIIANISKIYELIFMPRVKRVYEIIDEEWDIVRDKKHNLNYISKKEATKIFSSICFDFCVQDFSLEQIDSIIDSFDLPDFGTAKRIKKQNFKENVGKFYFILTKIQKKLNLQLGIKAFIQQSVADDQAKNKKEIKSVKAKLQSGIRKINLVRGVFKKIEDKRSERELKNLPIDNSDKLGEGFVSNMSKHISDYYKLLENTKALSLRYTRKIPVKKTEDNINSKTFKAENTAPNSYRDDISSIMSLNKKQTCNSSKASLLNDYGLEFIVYTSALIAKKFAPKGQ